ncbi:MAG: anhydro-N-acetylmuramic acid kinase, partial [Flavobacteriaceae bacterium]
YTACLNLGGFANFSTTSGKEVIAYDLCAVNTVLNLLAAEKGVDYDDQGHFAQSGKLLPALYEALSALDFYSKKGPKSLGIEWVNQEIIPLLTQFDNAKVEDKLHTYTQHIAHQISASFSDRDRVLVTGGGAKNSYLIKTLRERSQAQFILPSADLIDFKEALIFAFLGVLRKENQINCLSSVTGARTNHCSGIIFYPQD